MQIRYRHTEGLTPQDDIWYCREMLGRPSDDLADIADTLELLASAGCYGESLRVIARK
jgi:hypothetical protein